MYDVIIIGGSYAGLAAALQLGRARRSVLVIDAGQRRNRAAAHSHGFLGQDGVSPAEIQAKGRAEVLAYPTVSWLDGSVDSVARSEDGFVARIGERVLSCRRLILATGVIDELPAIPGLRERWGRSIFHCPYCHGYELNRGKLGALAVSELSLHHAVLVSEWGKVTVFLNEAFEPSAEQLADLDRRGISLERARLSGLSGDAPAISVELTDGRSVALDGLFLMSRGAPADSFAGDLGCELEASPVGLFYKTDAMKETTARGVYACGDAALMAGSVSFAVADGVRAGLSAHQSLVFAK